jgi:hypothetical protein
MLQQSPRNGETFFCLNLARYFLSMTEFSQELSKDIEAHAEENEKRKRIGLSSKDRLKRDVANALKWASIALIGIFFASVISSILPIQLLNPLWQDKLINSIRGGASFPLEAVLFMMLACVLSPNNPFLIKYLQWIRTFAEAMSLIFLLMIPLQLYTGFKVIGGRATSEFESLAALKRGAFAIDQSVSEAEFRAALGSIPGAPPLPATKLTETIPSLKANVLQQINPQIKQLETLIEKQRRRRTELFIGFSIRDVFICLLYALAFGAMARKSFFLNFSHRKSSPRPTKMTPGR